MRVGRIAAFMAALIVVLCAGIWLGGHPAKLPEFLRDRFVDDSAGLNLEASELIESIRGKHGIPLEEATDVLLVLMSITESFGIPWPAVLKQARATVEEMMIKPPYPGEEHAAAPSAQQPGEIRGRHALSPPRRFVARPW